MTAGSKYKTKGNVRTQANPRCEISGSVEHVFDIGQNQYGRYRGLKIRLTEEDLVVYEKATTQYIKGEVSEKARDEFIEWGSDFKTGEEVFSICVFEKPNKDGDLEFALRQVGDRVTITGFMSFTDKVTTDPITKVKTVSETEKMARFSVDRVL